VLIHISGFQSFPTKRVINKNIRFSFLDGGVCLHFVGYDAVLIPSPGKTGKAENVAGLVCLSLFMNGSSEYM
jgi:hypothetical protein